MLRRVTAETAMNSTSSRSHAILSVMVQQTSTFDGYTQVKRSKFSFVDLAGSERLKRTQAQGQRMKEGVDINKGLLVLGNVISALGDETKQGKTFVPYRDSKLTRLLKGSLGGNHKTLMIACVSPSSNNLEESLNCLRYANRAKNIQNNAVVNVDAGSRLVSELRCTIQLLAKDLLRIRRGGDKLKSDSMTEEMLEKLANGDGGEFKFVLTTERQVFDLKRPGDDVFNRIVRQNFFRQLGQLCSTEIPADPITSASGDVRDIEVQTRQRPGCVFGDAVRNTRMQQNVEQNLRFQI